MSPRIPRRCLLPGVLLSLSITVLASGCGLPGQSPVPPTPSPTPPILDVRINTPKTTLDPGERVELVAEASAGSGQEWHEIDAVWRAYPENLGILEVPPMQETGTSRTSFTAKASGRVTILAEPPSTGPIKGRVILDITGPAATPTPEPTPTGTPKPVQPSVSPSPAATPAPIIRDTPELRNAIAELDRLDWLVFSASDSFVAAFRAFGSNQIKADQLRKIAEEAAPRLDAASEELKRFKPPAELEPVYQRYLAVAERLRFGLTELTAFARTQDPKRSVTYGDAMVDALVMSAMAKAELDGIANAIGMPAPRSPISATPVITPSPTPR